MGGRSFFCKCKRPFVQLSSFLTIVATGDRNCHVLCTLYWKKYHSYSFVALAALLMLHTHNNTDGYKLEFFFLYYGGNYVVYLYPLVRSVHSGLSD